MRKIHPGDKFGRLTVACVNSSTTRKDGRAGELKWECNCECGKKIVARTSNLTSGNTNSCGCYKSDIVKKSNSDRDNEELDNNAYCCKCGSVKFNILKSRKIECSSCGVKIKISEIYNGEKFNAQ